VAVVVVVGSVNVDLVVTAERLPAPGETVAGGEFAVHQGGKGGNQAVAAARAGAAVEMVGAVGADDYGAGALAALGAEGIGTTLFQVVADAATGVALIAVDRSGANQIVVASGANHRLAHVPPLPAGDGVVLVGFEVTDDVVTEAVAAARDRGWPVIVNPAPARPLPAALRGSGAILVPNEGEAAVLGGGDPHALAAITGGPVVVTLGAAGARVIDAEGVLDVPAPIVDAVDTTGAGDTLAGVLAASLAAGLPLPAAVRRAVAAASLSVTRPGARDGMPRAAEIARLAE
jgi:ribokinase